MQLIKGDCLEVLQGLEPESVDMVLADPPYGTTACKWDSVIPFEDMWRQLRRVAKPKAAIVLMASQPFTSALISSNFKEFRHSWVWEKNVATNFFHAKRMPLRRTEDLCVFGKKSPNYYPIKTEGHVPTQSAKGKSHGVLYHGTNTRDYDGGDTTRYPTNILRFDVHDNKNRIHPTQKPVDLMDYMIRTYTQPGEYVLDFTMGSGTTGEAALLSGREFIGIEKDPDMAFKAQARLNRLTS